MFSIFYAGGEKTAKVAYISFGYNQLSSFGSFSGLCGEKDFRLRRPASADCFGKMEWKIVIFVVNLRFDAGIGYNCLKLSRLGIPFIILPGFPARIRDVGKKIGKRAVRSRTGRKKTERGKGKRLDKDNYLIK